MKIILTLSILIHYIYAHPHTFIDIHPTITVKNNIISKISFKWIVDDMTSSMLIMEVDENNDGKLSKAESQFVYDNYFLPLQDYEFYTNIFESNKQIKFPKPINYKSYIENNKLCYIFDIDNLQLNASTTKFDFGDTDFFVAMILKKEFVKIDNGKIKVSDLDNDFYFGYRMEVK